MRGNTLQLFRSLLYTQSLPSACKLNNNGILRSASFRQNYETCQEKYTVKSSCGRGFHTSVILNHRSARIVLGETKGVSPSKLRGQIFDESDNVKENLDALESASLAAETNKSQHQTIADEDEFQLYPDETTGDTFFKGLK